MVGEDQDFPNKNERQRQMINYEAAISTGTEIEFHFPGTQEELENAQELFHNRIAKREKFIQMCNDNAIRGIQRILQKKYGNEPVTVSTVLRTIRDNWYLDEEFLKDTFLLTTEDVHRALDRGLVPPSIKDSLAQYFEIKD